MDIISINAICSCRGFDLIFDNGSVKSLISALLVLILAVSVFSSSIVFAKTPKPLTEYGGGFRTYYNTSTNLEENVRSTLGIKSSTGKLGATVSWADIYIDADGLMIDYFNRTNPYYKLKLHWQEKENAVANMKSKTLTTEGRSVTVAFSDQAKAYIDDKVMNKMLVTQIAFDLAYQNKKYKYDHQAFVDELIKRGAYVIEEVLTPEQFTFNLFKTKSGGVAGTKPITSFDTKVKIKDIFKGKAILPKTIDNGEGNQGIQIGKTFAVKNGETLAIDIKELTDKSPTISFTIVDETTCALVYWNPAEMSGKRTIFTPGKNEANHTFKVLASGEEKDHVNKEIFTYKTGEAESL